MRQFHRGIRSASKQILTESDIDQLRDMFETHDERGDRITVGSALWPQFAFAHQAYDSLIVENDSGEEVAFNRYDFKDDGTGVYGDGTGKSFLHHGDGRFKFSGHRLPVVSWDGPDGSHKSGELAADMGRVNENPNLRLLHRIFAKMHNKRMDAGDSFDQARLHTVATMCNVSLDECSKITGLHRTDVLNEMVYGKMHLDVSFNFGIARLPHALTPSTVQGFGLQDNYEPDPELLYDGTEMAASIKLGISSAMREIKTPGGVKDIVQLTTSRHNQLELPCWSDVCRHYRVTDKAATDIVTCPIWFGALAACAAYSEDPHELHPAVARMYADGVAGTLLWADESDEGIFYSRGMNGWKNAPNNMLEVVDYVYG